MKVLFWLASPFVLHPELAFAVAAAFAVLPLALWLRSRVVRPGRSLLLGITATAWVLFGLNEIQAKAAGWNIRVDLLVSWPVLLALSIAAAWGAISELRRPRLRREEPQMDADEHR